ncbi:pro-neuregulin-3%2C membrane-bound isoform [Scomber scombrus]|uniref:Pro-neuregulin-3, membrane-bound isoform n=1 Tax=Scomber scombrus TaxID=13677 RepID=A0AAV1PYE0_SCOSC
MQGDNRHNDPRRDAFLHMQTPVSMEMTSTSPWSDHVEVCSGLCAPFQNHDLNPVTRSLRRPGRRHNQSPPPPFRSCSIPIIPSVQCHHDNEVSCMQTAVTPATTVMSTCGATPCKEERRERAAHAALSSTSCSSTIGQKRDEVALLLEEAQEQLRALALAHRKQEEGGIGSSSGGSGGSGGGGGNGSAAAPVEARETVCFLNLNGGGVGALSCNGPTQTQLLSPSLSHRDLGQSGQ